jgi:hypothetical protein
MWLASLHQLPKPEPGFLAWRGEDIKHGSAVGSDADAMFDPARREPEC